ncbi:hypothetical protein OSTOST_09674, partial [Ostertagia ostertagi]
VEQDSLFPLLEFEDPIRSPVKKSVVVNSSRKGAADGRREGERMRDASVADASNDDSTCYSLGQVSRGSNKVDFTVDTYGEWKNPHVISLENIVYEGFRLNATLTEISGEPIDEWNATFANASQLQGIYTYTSQREGLLGTSLTVAWTTTDVLPPTPPPPTTPTTTTTVATTTQGLRRCTSFPGHNSEGGTLYLQVMWTNRRTCDEFKNRTDAVKTIYINNAAVDVYCQYGNPGAYTVIQRTSLERTSGVEMRTTQGMYMVGGDMRSFDGVSYDRVRMAIFRSGQTPVATKPFCS